jgi:choline kinase
MISPMMLGKPKPPDQDEDFLDLDRPAKQFSANVGSKNRLAGRVPVERISSRTSLNEWAIGDVQSEAGSRPQSRHGAPDSLLSQVKSWLHQEKARRASRREKSKAAKEAAHDVQVATSGDGNKQDATTPERRGSDTSEGDVALDQLAAILASMNKTEQSWSRRPSHRRKSSARMRRQSGLLSSDTEGGDSELLVPHADVVLDNTKTMSYTGGAADDISALNEGETDKEKEAWKVFKYEVVRLAHTLGLKGTGWRRVPLEQSNEVNIERLSGALTNAVYVVTPPAAIPDTPRINEGGTPVVAKRPPHKLLLRIYGPQVGHLIDRESELQILRRLCRRNIGPRMLGTFTNGRFEEFFNGLALKAKDLHVPETSKQIAKRMRELHEGIELLPEERQSDPFAWKNWDKWVDRCEQIVTWLDKETLSGRRSSVKSLKDERAPRMLLCGAQWELFKSTYEKYRKWLIDQYGGVDKIRERMVFAHNDVSIRGGPKWQMEKSYSHSFRLSMATFFDSSRVASLRCFFLPMHTSSSLSSITSMLAQM